MKRAVLAYSGGLDTSVTIRWLVEQGYEVHAVAVDVGQQEDFDGVVERGRLAGAADVRVVDAVDRFAADYLVHAIKANGLYEGKYPMVSGLARPLIVEEVVKVAREIGADVVAHGCTGKGNDQVRFEVSFGVLAPDLEVLAPIRDANIPREKALVLAEEWGIPLASIVSSYSVDENLWGRTAECGPLEDPWVAPPEDAFARTASPEDRPSEPAEIVDRLRARPARGARRRGGRPAVRDPFARRARRVVRVRPGRHDREPARGHQVARALRGAGRARDHPGPPRARGPDARSARWRTTSRSSNSAGPTSSTTASGSRRCGPRSTRTSTRRRRTSPATCGCASSPGTCTVVGRRSANSLYDLSLATYGSGDAFDQSHAEGYVRLYGLPLKVWSAKQGGA